MTQITDITKEVCKRLSNEISADLQALAEKYDLVIERGSAKYSTEGTYMDLNIKVSTKRSDGTVITEKAQAFIDCAAVYGLKPEDLGRVFTQGSTAFTITGLSTRNRKYKILAKSSKDGKTYKFKVDAVITRLEMAA